MDELAGVTAIETSPGVTMRPKDPFTEPTFAKIEHEPPFLAVSRPPVATAQTFASEELQVAVEVRS